LAQRTQSVLAFSHLERHFDPVGQGQMKMLTNYDAKAVADVMGIAFLRGPDGGPPLGAKSASGASVEKFVISIGADSVRIVEIKTNNRFARFGQSNGGINQPFAPKKGQIRSPSSVLIEKAVEEGLPRFVLRHVAEQLAGGDKAKISPLEWIVVPKTTLERREYQLSPQESERTERVARLFVHARRALGTEAEAREFMTTPHPQLEERSPIDAARTDLGTRRTEQILNALEYGLAL
jgi:putative toxin-antitoxin system antitoxin component (TIGR02293 family)